MGRQPSEPFPAPKNAKNVPLALDGKVAAGLQRFVEKKQEALRAEDEDWRAVTMNRVLNRAALLYYQNLIRTGQLTDDEEPAPPPKAAAKRKR